MRGRCDGEPKTAGSARPSELLFDLAVGGRLWRELVEGRVEEALGVFVSALAEADNGEVCDHLSLVLLVAELSKDVERLLEVLNRYGDAAAMYESESEIVERQRLGLPVTELTHDRERGTMLLGCLFVLAFTSKLRPELIESKRLTLPVDRDWFRPKGLRGARSQPADHRAYRVAKRRSRCRSPSSLAAGSVRKVCEARALNEPTTGAYRVAKRRSRCRSPSSPSRAR